MNKRPIGLCCKVIAGVVASALVLAQTPLAMAQGPTHDQPSKAHAAKPAAAPKADLAAAKRHYGAGEKRFKAGDYAGALAEFQAANDIKATPQVDRYIGLCEDKLGRYPAAVEWYDKFLAHVPAKMTAQGDELKARSAEIRAMPGKVHVDSNPSGAEIAIDDKPAAGPTPADVELAPGTHTIKLSAPGHTPSTQTVDVTFASSQTVTADLPAEAPPPPPPPPPAPAPVAAAAAPPPPAPLPAAPPPPPEARSKVPAFVTGGLAIAAAGVGTVFGIVALGDKSDFDKNPTTSTADSGDTHALIADMAFGVALTFGVTSAVLFLTKDDAPATSSRGAATDGAAVATAAKEKTAMTIVPAPIIGPHTGGAGLTLRF